MVGPKPSWIVGSQFLFRLQCNKRVPRNQTKYTLVHIPPRLFTVCVTSTRSVAACDYVTHSIHKQQYDIVEATDIKRMKHKSGMKSRCSSSFVFRAPSVHLGCTAAWRLIVPAPYSILTVPTFTARCLSASYTTRDLQAAKGGTICGRETRPIILPRDDDFHDTF